MGARHVFDLAILGAGLSTSYFFLELLAESEASDRRPHRPLSIVVVDKDPCFWTGIQSGPRSSICSLTITNLDEYLPSQHKYEFFNWLEENKAAWMASFSASGGDLATKWLETNHALIEQCRWGQIYLPRYLFGIFLREKVQIAIEKMKRNGLAQISMICGEATSLSKYEGHFEASIDSASLQSQKIKSVFVVLALGSPPYQSIAQFAAGVSSDVAIFDDPYAPSLNETLAALYKHLSETAHANRNVFILGSNAASLEILYHLERHERLDESIDKIVVLSRSGQFPHCIGRNAVNKISLPALASLKTSPNLSASNIIDAVERDVHTPSFLENNISKVVPELLARVHKLLDGLPVRRKKEFYTQFGMRLTNIIRRAGPEYRQAADALVRNQKLTLISGDLIRLAQAPDETARIQYRKTIDNELATYPESFTAVLNCSGFEKLTHTSSSRLIRSLISNDICRVNRTGRGFEVDDQLQAADKLYVAGPMLAGAFNSFLRCWHLENLRRTSTVSRMLAKTLYHTTILACSAMASASSGSDVGARRGREQSLQSIKPAISPTCRPLDPNSPCHPALN